MPAVHRARAYLLFILSDTWENENPEDCCFVVSHTELEGRRKVWGPRTRQRTYRRNFCTEDGRILGVSQYLKQGRGREAWGLPTGVAMPFISGICTRALKIALNQWNSASVMHLISGIWCR
jgi:hypothetical protein